MPLVNYTFLFLCSTKNGSIIILLKTNSFKDEFDFFYYHNANKSDFPLNVDACLRVRTECVCVRGKAETRGKILVLQHSKHRKEFCLTYVCYVSLKINNFVNDNC